MDRSGIHKLPVEPPAQAPDSLATVMLSALSAAAAATSSEAPRTQARTNHLLVAIVLILVISAIAGTWMISNWRHDTASQRTTIDQRLDRLERAVNSIGGRVNQLFGFVLGDKAQPVELDVVTAPTSE